MAKKLKNSTSNNKYKPPIFIYCVRTICYLFIFVNTKVYVTKILFDLKFLASVATVMVLSEYTATIKLIKLLQQINDRFDINNKP